MEARKPLFTRGDKLLAGLVTGFTLLVYAATLTPSLSYQSPDGNELATVPFVLGLAHSPGYPIYTWMGKLFTLLPLRDVAFRVNLMSAVCASLAAAGVFLILSRLLDRLTPSTTIRRWSAAVPAFVLAFSPTWWSQAVIAEVYAPNLFLIVVTLLALLNWDHRRTDGSFFLFTFSYGLSLGGHLSNLAFAPALALFVLFTQPRALKRPRFWLAGLGGFALGAAQYLWLPFKAATLLDPVMVRWAPDSLADIYRYTLGAFPQFKFAFPLQDLPDRLVLYILLLLGQFGLFGVTVGVIGLWSTLLRRWRMFYLLFGIYLVEVFFFIQYSVFDLDVFFLPAHLLWALFLGFGMMEALTGLASLVRRIRLRPLYVAVRWGLTILGLLLILYPMLRTWRKADRSFDTAANDFYAAVWEMLPSDSILITRGGVFGYDAFYWQLVYDTRPDVILPLLNPQAINQDEYVQRPLYSTTTLPRGQAPDRRLFESVLAPLEGQDYWAIPLVMGESGRGTGLAALRPLFLVELSLQPPELVIEGAQPDIPINEPGLPLVGVDLPAQPVESGATLELTLYWQLQQPVTIQVSTQLDGNTLESHRIGFGNLERYHREIQPINQGTVVEHYALVVPSDVSPGEHDLSVEIGRGGSSIRVATIEIVDEEGMLARWQRIAGK
jgi:hypothetical protein